MTSAAAQTVIAKPRKSPAFLAERRAVSVVMVVYRTGKALEESLGCVLRDPLVDELVVVDNGSTPTETQMLSALAERDARVTLVTGQGNVGFARGANLGAKRARGDILVFLNPDAFLQPGCIAELVRGIEGRTVPSIVGGRVLNADRSEQRGGRRGEVTALSAVLSLTGLARRFAALRRYEIHWEHEALPEAALPTPTVSGACLCMRREDFQVLRGFDEGYFLHVEDIDLCWRARRHGGEVVFSPKAEVIHLGHTSHVNPLRVELHKGLGLARYFRKRAGTLSERLLALLIAPVVVGAAVARPLLRLAGGAQNRS